MSINACSVNYITTDDLCRRAQNLATLPPFVPSATKSHPQKVNPSYDNLSIFRRDPDHTDPLENQVDVSTLELPYIAVTVEMAGETFTQTLDRNDENSIPMINVYNVTTKVDQQLYVSIADIRLECVNISDIRLRILK